MKSRHVVEVVVLVDVRASTPLGLRQALAELRREAPHIDQTTAGHTAGFALGCAKKGHDYVYSLRSRRQPASVRVRP